MREYIVAGVGFLTTIIGTLLAHLITKRKYSAEVDRILIENIEKAFDLYKKLTEETESKVDSVITKYNIIEQEKIEMENKIDILTKRIDELTAISCTINNCDKRKKIKKEKSINN